MGPFSDIICSKERYIHLLARVQTFLLHKWDIGLWGGKVSASFIEGNRLLVVE